MRYKALLCAALALAAEGTTYAQPEPTASIETRKPISFKFEKVKKNTNNLPRQFRNRKRSNTVLQHLDNQDFLYYANVSIGTPPQSLRLHLDTGSSDIWVESAQSSLCQSVNDPCNVTGVFDTSASSTYKTVANDFDISYVDGEYARGDYGKDTFHLGDVNVTGLQFGIGLDSTSTEGIMGIGFNSNEVQVQRLGKDPYPNLVDLMVEQNLIRSRAYSLWLNDLEASKGEILFGGVDTAKFRGNLTTLPIDLETGETQATDFMITLTSVSLTNDVGKSLTITNDNFAVPALLDTGSSYTYLPTDLATELANQVGAQMSARIGVPIVPCEIRNYNGTINYGFSGAIINVPLNELAVDAYTDDGSPATYNDGTPLCYFGILDAGNDSNVLGDTFLRSAYVVYDLDNQEISIGNTLYNVTESNVVEIGTGSDAVPDATSALSAVTVAPTAARGNRGNNLPYASGEATRTGGGFISPTNTSAAQCRTVGFGFVSSL
ncbi:hypothetical protein RUND412_002455, partial [Rhizina undulata]